MTRTEADRPAPDAGRQRTHDSSNVRPHVGRRRRPDRGCPAVEALRDLARTYLETQRALWPKLVEDGTLPEPSADVLANMATDFRVKFLGERDVTWGLPARSSCWNALAASYLRYSSENSNPRSLDQQLKLQLERAANEDNFIPWNFVFADAAVTATSADRHGYNLAKQSLAIDALKLLYIDEVGRASRDAIEAMRLGRLVDARHKRMIGVSDGFDSHAPMSKMMLSIFGVVQEWFVDQLRTKVKRGMNDAFDRGTNLAPPPVGYDLVPATDADGRPVVGKDGVPLKSKAVNADANEVLEAFKLYGLEGRSPNQLARRFNEKAVGGSTTWSDNSIRKMLQRHIYVGIQVYHRTYQVRDPETGTIKIYERPRNEWRVRRVRNLQIVPWQLWKTVRARVNACKLANGATRDGGGLSRSDIYPTVLVRPVCGSCGANLMLTRTGDGGKYASFFCRNSVNGNKGCTHKGSKAVRIIEETILGELRAKVFTDQFVGRVLEHANRFLGEEALRPREDTGPLEAEIRSVRSKRDRLVTLLEGGDGEGDEDGGRGQDEGDDGALVSRVRQHERHLKELRRRLAELKSRNEPPPPPLTAPDIERVLSQLRDLLAQDVALAAPVLRALTGPVVVNLVHEPGKQKPTWVAKFAVDLVPVALALTPPNCPTRRIWEPRLLNK
jgi:DNA invertase Pin-like site-specific DNA recombinase